MAIFISYSRLDKPFVRQLYDELIARGETVWVDWQDIPGAADWWNEIADGIEQADNVVFVISPHSLASPVCHLEIAYALRLNKRFVPILLLEADAVKSFAELIARSLSDNLRAALGERDLMSIARENWQHISRHNWIEFVSTDTFTENLQHLIRTMNQDLDYVREHTRWLRRAREWEKRDHNAGFLLHGAELEEARKWLKSAAGKEPEATKLHWDYITRSIRHAQRGRKTAIAAITALILLSLGIGAGVVFGLINPPDPTRPMMGAFNVAVAAFYEQRPNGSVPITRDSERLSQLVATSLQESLPETTEVRVGLDAITGQNPLEREQAAAALAGKLFADVVVYGFIDTTRPNQIVFVPEFYISPSLTGADEVTGANALGSPVPLRLPIVEPDSDTPFAENWNPFRQRFQPRLQAFTAFFDGLGALKGGDFEHALARFNEARTVAAWQDSEGKEILYLWIGTLFEQAYSGDRQAWAALECPLEITTSVEDPLLACASSAYDYAGELNIRFVRADLGAGNVLMDRFLTEPIDCYWVMEAIGAYERALDDTADTSALILAKAHYGLGRAYQFGHTPTNDPNGIQCHWFFDVDFLREAERHLSQTVEIVGSLTDTPYVDDIAARSHYQLGLIHARQQDYQGALADYGQVISIAEPEDPTRAQDWQSIRWFARWRLADLHRRIALDSGGEADWQAVRAYSCEVLGAVDSHQFTAPAPEIAQALTQYANEANQVLGRQRSEPESPCTA